MSVINVGNDNKQDSEHLNNNAGHQVVVTQEGTSVIHCTPSHTSTKASKKFYLREKLIHTTGVLTFIVLAIALTEYQWIIPYYFVISCPFLWLIRYILYWKTNNQIFLLDFCYWVNLLCYIYLWASPDSIHLHAMIFGAAHGPLAWAVPLWRNSAVFHDYEKMTSVYIHVLPMYITFCIRWFPESTSTYWYRPFVQDFNQTSEDIKYQFLWISAYPLVFFVLHFILYNLIVFQIIYRYVSPTKYPCAFVHLTASFHFFFKRIKERFIPVIYAISNYLVAFITLSFSIISYRYFYANVAFLLLISISSIWNGATFYMDVFGIRGHKRKPEWLIGDVVVSGNNSNIIIPDSPKKNVRLDTEPVDEIEMETGKQLESRSGSDNQ